MELWGDIWQGAISFVAVAGVLGVVIGLIVKAHKLMDRFEDTEELARKNQTEFAAHRAEYQEERKEMMAEIKKQSATLKVGTHSDIYNLCVDAIRQGHCAEGKRKLIANLNEQYKAMGGNGDVKDLVSKAYALPLEKQQEENNG